MNSAVKEETRESRSIGSRFRSVLVRGLAALLPLYLTFIMIQFLIRTFSRPLTPAARWLTRFLSLETNPWVMETIIVGSSLLASLLLISMVGVIAQRVVGKRIVGTMEAILKRLPVIRTIYSAFREFTSILTGDTARSYQKVVMVTLPDNSGKVLGFITGTLAPGDGTVYHAVFVPTAPNITTGFLLLLRSDQFQETTISPEDGLKIVLSAGVLTNEKLKSNGLEVKHPPH